METYKNTGLLYYKHYFDDTDLKHYDSIREKEQKKRADKINQEKIKEKNEILFNSVLDNTDYEGIGNQKFDLATVYPGLFTGSGYPHEANIEGELKLGFFFDYTTGLPVIPGSSVKGVLRDAFEKADGKYVIELLNKIDVDSNKIEYLFEKVKVDDRKEKVPFIVKHIFYGYTKAQKENDKEVIVDKELNVYQKDKFFDAFPVGKKDSRQFLGDDYITPHKDPLKNPVPLRFLKVLPNVTFRFDFELHDLKDENGNKILSAHEKSKLFKRILLDLGIGAKTNVGYGQFTDEKTVENDVPTGMENEPDFIEKDGIEPNAEISCRIDKIIYRANENLYQLYLIPYIKEYKEFLKELNKPLPSIKLRDYQVRVINEGDIKRFIVNRIGKDGRVFFKNEII